MNIAIQMGRLTRDPEIRWSQGQEQMCVARFTVAVDRTRRTEGKTNADFFAWTYFGKQAEFAEKYLKQGVKVVCTGHPQNGSYTDKDGIKRYTTDFIGERIEFAESKKAAGETERPAPMTDQEGFLRVPDGMEEDLPFA